MQYLPLVTAALMLAALTDTINGESHTVHFDNRCGSGTPTLIQDATVLSTGEDYVSEGPLVSAVAYLQTGSCGSNGEGCTLIEATLENAILQTSGSSVDINLIPPFAYNVATGFSYSNGCTGAGSDCNSPNCSAAIRLPNETTILQVLCQADDVGLDITFCDGA